MVPSRNQVESILALRKNFSMLSNIHYQVGFMPRTLVLFFTCLLTIQAWANPYYGEDFLSFLQSPHQKKQFDLKRELHRILKAVHLSSKKGADQLLDTCPQKVTSACYSHQLLDYQEARRNLFGKLHLQQNSNGYYIEDVYCETKFYPNIDVGPNRIPDHRYLNCEHTWPQSKFGGLEAEYKKSDLHHLFPSDSELNAMRGHLRFGEVEISVGTPLKCRQNQRGEIDGERDFFEPADEHKGNIARAMFYFSIRYRMPISKTEEYYLRKWHQEDPIDEFEQKRNEEIYKIQFTRNPFIDFPVLVDLIENF